LNQVPDGQAMPLRTQFEARFRQRSPLAVGLYLAVPALCLAIPGPGVLLAAVWALLFLWLCRQKVALVGLRAPEKPLALIGLSLGLAALIWIVDGLAITPIAEALTGTTKDLGAFADLERNWSKFLLWLTLGWLVGGIVEEFVFRGFLINVGVHILGDRLLWPLAIASSIVFGISHLYQGPVGVISTGAIAFLFAVVFIVSGRNLLLVILAHGFVNTISLGLAFLGLRALA